MAPAETTAPSLDEPEVCPHCGETVPDSAWCGACGAPLESDPSGRARRRWRSYAAFPDQHLLGASVASALFPKLASSSRPTFRVAVGVVAVVLVAVAAARLDAVVVAISAFAVPLLFVCYLAETETSLTDLIPALGTLALGAVLGVAFALWLGGTVADALVPNVSSSLGGATVLRSALLAPVVVQLLMAVPVSLLRLRRPPHAGPMEGFSAGAAGALGFSAAVTLVELSSRVLVGNVGPGSTSTVIGEAALRGISVPLVGAAATGYFGAALWRRRGSANRAGGRWLTSPLAALGVGMVLQVGLGFADDARLSDVSLIVIHLVATLFALAASRIGLHHVLLHDQPAFHTGEEHTCPHCHRTVPSMPFCPACGVFQGATPAAPGEPGTARRLGSRRLLGVLVGGLAVAGGLFTSLAAVLPVAAAVPCTALRCFSPFGPVQAQPGHTYANAAGWRVTWYPASAVFPSPAPATTASPSSKGLRLAFTSPTSPAEDGDLFFVGLPADGRSAAQLVATLQQSNAPNATLDYVLFNPTVGYHLGYGASYVTTPATSYGNGTEYEVVITCAVVHALAVCAYGVGPRVDVSQVVNHPTPSKLAMSLWTDPDVNSVVWGPPSG